MKLSVHGDRNGSADHNDRNFNYQEKAPHIQAEKVKENVYFGVEGNSAFKDFELNYYKENFMQAIKEQNKKNVAARHANRNKTVEDLYNSRKTKPEEVIIQIGNKRDKFKDKETFKDIILDYMDQFNEKYQSNCKILDVAIHYDETNIHAHVRRVWFVETDKGKIISQNKALDELGYERPDLNEENNRYNNAKITFTDAERKMVMNICKEHGVKLEKTNHKSRVKSLPMQEHKLKVIEEELRRVTKEVEKMKFQKETYEKIHDLVEKKDPEELELAINNVGEYKTENENLKLENQELKHRNEELKEKILEAEKKALDAESEYKHMLERIRTLELEQRKLAELRKKYKELDAAISQVEQKEQKQNENETNEDLVI